METGTSKSIWWFILACAGTGFLAWGLLVLFYGLPAIGDSGLVLWPLTAFAACVVSICVLRSLYRKEPRQFGGRWQLSLKDLIVLSLATGVLIALWGAILPESGFTYIPVGLMTGLLFFLSLLLATRIGFSSGAARYGFAVGHVLRVFGFLGASLFVFFFLFVLLSRPAMLGGFLDDVLLHNTGGPEFLVWPMRIGLVCLLPGLFLCRISLRHRTTPPAGDSIE